MNEDAFIKIKIKGLKQKISKLQVDCQRVCCLKTLNLLYKAYLERKNSKFLGLFKRKEISFNDFVINAFDQYRAAVGSITVSCHNTIWSKYSDTVSYHYFCEDIKMLINHSSAPEIFFSEPLVNKLNNLEIKAGYIRNFETLVEDLVVKEKSSFEFITKKLAVH
jgi:hypothetical protein